MLKLLTSVNWLIGPLILGAAFLAPEIIRAALVQPMKNRIEESVLAVVALQRDHYTLREKFRMFSGKVPNDLVERAETVEIDRAVLNNPNVTVEAFESDDSPLVVRGYTTPEAVRDGWHAPALYEYRASENIIPEEATGTWRQLSGASYGTLSALMELPKLVFPF